MPNGTILTTTAGRLDSKSGKFAHGLYSSGMPWTEKLFDLKNKDELYNVIKKNCGARRKQGGAKIVMLTLDFNHRQLGKTDEWLKKKMEESLSSGIDAETDYLNIWSSGSEESPIPVEILTIVNASVKTDYYTELSEFGYATRWYVNQDIVENYLEKEEMVLAIDTSNAVGNDDIALNLRSLKSGNVIAVGQYNETNLITFSEFVFSWILRYPNLTIIMENRINAMAIFDNLIILCRKHGINPFQRLFNWIVDEADLHPKDFANINRPVNEIEEEYFIKYRKHFGFATSGSGRSSRDKLYGIALIQALKYTGSGVRDKNLAGQIAGLKLKNGRMDHEAGSKDDLVIAYMLSYFFMTNAKNISFYGHNPALIMSTAIRTESVEEEIEAKHQMIKNERIVGMINELAKLMTETRNPTRLELIKTKIMHLGEMLPEENKTSFNNDARLSSMNPTKNKKKYWEYS